MSDYKYETENERLDIRQSVNPEKFLIWVHEGRNEAAILVSNSDAPTVAAELLKAAGQESVIVAKAYEEVRVYENGVLECGDGPEYANALTSSNPNWLRNRAANCIAVAEYIENKAQRETEAATKLQERREEMSEDYGYTPFLDAPPAVRSLINRVIELEDGK